MIKFLEINYFKNNFVSNYQLLSFGNIIVYYDNYHIMSPTIMRREQNIY